jgi:VWFA-related protein
MRLLLCAISLPLLISAQPTIRVTTRLVDVSVIVRDGKGPVSDLRKDDFKVFDNGVERPIAFFVVNSTRAPAKPPIPRAPNVFTNRAESRDDAPARVTVFVIDALNTEFESQARVRQQFLRYAREITPRDRVAVWVMTDRLRRVQDFTNDPKQLAAAIEHVSPNIWLVPDRPAAASQRAPSNEGESMSNEAAKTADEMQQYYRMQLTNDLLRDLATSLGRIPGRKNLVWLSAAFPLNMSIGPGGPETAYVEGRLSGTGRALSKGNVAMYPVDARGLVAPAGGQSAMAVSTSELHRHDSMNVLAAATGGRAIYDSNDITSAIREAVNDAEVTYTLGFYPGPGGADGAYHKLQIETVRRGAELRYARGLHRRRSAALHGGARRERRDPQRPLECSRRFGHRHHGAAGAARPEAPGLGEDDHRGTCRRFHGRRSGRQPTRGRWTGSAHVPRHDPERQPPEVGQPAWRQRAAAPAGASDAGRLEDPDRGVRFRFRPQRFAGSARAAGPIE